MALMLRFIEAAQIRQPYMASSTGLRLAQNSAHVQVLCVSETLYQLFVLNDFSCRVLFD